MRARSNIKQRRKRKTKRRPNLCFETGCQIITRVGGWVEVGMDWKWGRQGSKGKWRSTANSPRKQYSASHYSGAQHRTAPGINIKKQAIWFGTVPRDEGWAKEQLELQLEHSRAPPLAYGLIYCSTRVLPSRSFQREGEIWMEGIQPALGWVVHAVALFFLFFFFLQHSF